jgi:hypothetical protein
MHLTLLLLSSTFLFLALSLTSFLSLSLSSISLVRLDASVDSVDKDGSPKVTNRPRENRQRNATDKHVTKVKRGLKDPAHLRLDDKEINAVHENVKPSARGGEEGKPMPTVLFSVQ